MLRDIIMPSNITDINIMFSNKKKLKCPYCGTLRQFEEYDAKEILERHALAEHGFRLPWEPANFQDNVENMQNIERHAKLDVQRIQYVNHMLEISGMILFPARVKNIKIAKMPIIHPQVCP